MFSDFLCRVTAAGVPHSIKHIYQDIACPFSGFTGSEMCHLYWCLHSVVVRYRISIDGVGVISGACTLGNSSNSPSLRLLSPGIFSADYIDSSYNTRHCINLDFSSVYISSAGDFGVQFDLYVYNEEEGREDSTILLSLSRDIGTCRDASICRQFRLFDRDHDVFLNYSSDIWDSVELLEFSIDCIFFE